MKKDTKRISESKPSKPYPDFPLFAHATKRWAKKIRGKTHYFGPWSDPQGALKRYLEQRDELQLGRVPRSVEGATIRDLCNAFLSAKQLLVDNSELTERSFRDYYVTCAKLVEHFGRPRLVEDLHPSDFGRLRAELARTRGPVSLGNEITRIRVVMKFAFDSGMIERPVRYGSEFGKPNRKTLRKARAAKPRRFFDAEAMRRIIKAAPQPLKAMALLGINASWGSLR